MNQNILVVGGGWSVAELDFDETLRPYGYVIGVNDSAVHMPCDAAVTMDRLWLEHRWKAVLDEPTVTEFWVRRGVDKNVTRLLTPEQNRRMLRYWNTLKPELVSDHGYLNGDNSGLCAVNLAYQKAVKGDKVFLFGFDMNRNPETGSPYWYPPYPWAKPEGATKPGRYAAWALDFNVVQKYFKKAGVVVYNVSMTSAVKVFPKLTFEEFKRTANGHC